MTNAMTIPFCPPNACPETINRALIAAISKKILVVFTITIHLLLQ